MRESKVNYYRGLRKEADQKVKAYIKDRLFRCWKKDSQAVAQFKKSKKIDTARSAFEAMTRHARRKKNRRLIVGRIRNAKELVKTCLVFGEMRRISNTRKRQREQS